jgi:hypothetical protein
MNRPSGWLSVATWAVALALITLTLLGALSIGVFILPVAAAAVILAARMNRAWPEALTGSLMGIAGVLLWVAFGNRGYSPCLPQHRTMRLAPGESFSCGGRDPIPWLATGLVLATIGIVGYWAWRRRSVQLPALPDEEL